MGHIETLLERYPVLAGQEAEIREAGELLSARVKAGGKLLTCGNGGSASDAEHVVGELMKNFWIQRKIPQEMEQRLEAVGAQDLAGRLHGAIPAISLNSQTTLLTALLNDVDPALIFAQQVYGYGKEGDALLAFSTAPHTENVYNAVRVAKALGMATVLVCGKDGGATAEVADVAIHLPADVTFKIQELTLPTYHILCALMEQAMFG